MNVTILENTVYVNIIDDDTIDVTLLGNATQQAAIQFDDEGVALGTVGTVNEVDFTGAGVTGSRSGSKVTYNIPGGGGGGSGDVVGPDSSTADEVALFSGTSGKLLKSGGGVKDGTGGVAGLTLFKINFKNVLNTFTSFFTNSNTAARTYTFQDRDGTIADTFVDKITGSAKDRWFTLSDNLTAFGTVTAVINSLRGVPFPIRFPCTIDRLAMEVTTGTTGKIRFGIYADDGTGYPSTLQVDGGEVTITAPGVYPKTVNISLLPGIYHFCYITDTANTFRGTANASGIYSFMGQPSTLGTNLFQFYTSALSYQALPGTFPAGATISQANFPLIFFRLA